MSICINAYPYEPLYNNVRTRAKEKFPFLCWFILREGGGNLSLGGQLDHLNGRTLLAD